MFLRATEPFTPSGIRLSSGLSLTSCCNQGPTQPPFPRCLPASRSGAKRLLPYCQFFDEIFLNAITGPGLVADRNHSLPRNLHFRIDDVFLPVSLRGRDVSGQAEILQRRQRDVVGPADAGFEHAPAPDRNSLGEADFVDLLGFAKATHAS